jgi:hypothetical protein
MFKEIGSSFYCNPDAPLLWKALSWTDSVVSWNSKQFHISQIQGRNVQIDDMRYVDSRFASIAKAAMLFAVAFFISRAAAVWTVGVSLLAKACIRSYYHLQSVTHPTLSLSMTPALPSLPRLMVGPPEFKWEFRPSLDGLAEGNKTFIVEELLKGSKLEHKAGIYESIAVQYRDLYWDSKRASQSIPEELFLYCSVGYAFADLGEKGSKVDNIRGNLYHLFLSLSPHIAVVGCSSPDPILVFQSALDNMKVRLQRNEQWAADWLYQVGLYYLDRSGDPRVDSAIRERLMENARLCFSTLKDHGFYAQEVNSGNPLIIETFLCLSVVDALDDLGEEGSNEDEIRESLNNFYLSLSPHKSVIGSPPPDPKLVFHSALDNMKVRLQTNDQWEADWLYQVGLYYIKQSEHPSAGNARELKTNALWCFRTLYDHGFYAREFSGNPVVYAVRKEMQDYLYFNKGGLLVATA